MITKHFISSSTIAFIYHRTVWSREDKELNTLTSALILGHGTLDIKARDESEEILETPFRKISW